MPAGLADTLSACLADDPGERPLTADELADRLARSRGAGMIERLEVTPGPGTVIRYGGIVAWADLSASSALISFLAQSARNLGPSPRGGRQIADHIAGVLAARDPEPHVAFAVIGPSDHGWASLLHGPVQAWDGARWLAPTPSPGWLQAIITPRPAITVGAAGVPAPPVQPDAMWDLEAGVVPGAGFVLVPGAAPGRLAVVPAVDIDAVPPTRGPPTEVAATTALGAIPPTLVVSAIGAEREAERIGEDDSQRPLDAATSARGSRPSLRPNRSHVVVGAAAEVATADTALVANGEQEPEPESALPATRPPRIPQTRTRTRTRQPEPPKPEPVVRRPVAPGPAGSLDLRAVRPPPARPCPAAAAPTSGSPGLRWSPASSAVAATSTDPACPPAPAATPRIPQEPGNRSAAPDPRSAYSSPTTAPSTGSTAATWSAPTPTGTPLSAAVWPAR